jgi:hypothetical protein
MKHYKVNSFLPDYLGDKLKEIKNMISDYHKGDYEFEIAFHNINFPTYMSLLEDFIDITPNEEITTIYSLDVILDNYRVSFINENDIDEIVNELSVNSRDNWLNILKKYKANEILFKDRKNAKKMYFEDLDCIVRLTREKIKKRIAKN